MNFQVLTYCAGDTPVHRCDARVKLLVLLAYSIAIFWADTVLAVAGFAVVAMCAAAIARIPSRRLLASLAPVAFLALFAFAFAFAGSPGEEGFARGFVIAVRMLALVAASLIVCFTTASMALLRAFAWFIAPLRRLRVPVDDIALTLSLAIRFIPAIAEEVRVVRMAQVVRGADLPQRGLMRRFALWGATFSAVFVGLFRHADALAGAMDSRCYGAADHRTSLHE